MKDYTQLHRDILEKKLPPKALFLLRFFRNLSSPFFDSFIPSLTLFLSSSWSHLVASIFLAATHPKVRSQALLQMTHPRDADVTAGCSGWGNQLEVLEALFIAAVVSHFTLSLSLSLFLCLSFLPLPHVFSPITLPLPPPLFKTLTKSLIPLFSLHFSPLSLHVRTSHTLPCKLPNLLDFTMPIHPSHRSFPLEGQPPCLRHSWIRLRDPSPCRRLPRHQLVLPRCVRERLEMKR